VTAVAKADEGVFTNLMGAAKQRLSGDDNNNGKARS